MKKLNHKIVFHLLVNLLFAWPVLILGSYYGILGVLHGYIFNLVTVILCAILALFVHGPLTTRWISIAISCAFFTPKTALTKGYRFAMKDDGMLVDTNSKQCFFKIYFDDSQLRGGYIYLNNDAHNFKNGKLLEIVYYPRSKYIVAIRNVNDEK